MIPVSLQVRDLSNKSFLDNPIQINGFVFSSSKMHKMTLQEYIRQTQVLKPVNLKIPKFSITSCLFRWDYL